MSLNEPARTQHLWWRWVWAFLASGLALGAILVGFVVAMDPYGLRTRPGTPARPLMDLNQRYMYPQLVRSGAFDSAVVGTSTMRLLDPALLSHGIGGRFANLAMNAATPWEQVQMAKLFAANARAGGTVIWGLDLPWCSETATDPANRLTPRPFPPWLYETPSWLNTFRQMNLTTLEVSLRMLGNWFGLQPPRMRGDGYEVFTPPETSYDLARARFHLFAGHGGVAPDRTPLATPDTISATERAGWRFPALSWLDESLAALPQSMTKIVVLPPTHASGLPREGSRQSQIYDACKAALVKLAERHGAAVLDYAHLSSVTRADENYWDPLHYRLPIARRIEGDLAAIAKGSTPQADGVARLLRALQ